MKKVMSILWVLIITVAAFYSVHSATRYVDINSTNPVYPYTSWETAATNLHNVTNGLVSGDIVMINTGTYYILSHIELKTALTFMGASTNPEDVVVARDDSSTITNKIFYLRHKDAFLANLTVSNGYSAAGADDSVLWGGGIGIYEGGIVSNCIIRDNRTAIGRGGGGISMISGNAVIKECVIKNNTSASGGGIGIYSGASNILIESCVIYSNTVNPNYGGGLYINGTNILIEKSSIIGNSSGRHGGGAYINSAVFNITIRSCDFCNNRTTNTIATSANGGGIFVAGTVVIEDCVFSNNYSPTQSYASEMYVSAGDGSDKYIRRCKFLNGTNSALFISGGDTVIVENCEISGHYDYRRPAVFLFNTTNTILRNSVVWGNQTGNSSWQNLNTAGIGIYNFGRIENCTIVNNYRVMPSGVPGTGGLAGSNVVVINCIIYSNGISAAGADRVSDILVRGDQSVVMFSCSSNLVDGIDGCITSNPSFVQWPLGVGTGVASGNLDLMVYSPCVNKATNLEWMATNTDFRGSARLDKVMRLPDIGAYERIPAVFIFSVK